MKGLSGVLRHSRSGCCSVRQLRRAQGAEFSLAAGYSPPRRFRRRREDGFPWPGRDFVRAQLFPLGFQIDGMYQRLKFDDDPRRSVQPDHPGHGQSGLQVQDLRGKHFRPYLIGGGGIYNFKAVSGDDVVGPVSGDTEYGLRRQRRRRLRLQGRRSRLVRRGTLPQRLRRWASDAQFIPITVGIRLGGN